MIMNEYPKRKHLRLIEYDYSQSNYYFVTICTYGKKHLFGIGDRLTAYGKTAEKCLAEIPRVFPDICIDKYVIMPNHIHMIFVIKNSTDETARMYPRPTLGIAIGNFKSAVTREIHNTEPEIKVWQTGFYDHIIRDIPNYENIWTYIDENPIKWDSDEYY
jgi:REP element-mobilizing transposase RayT